MIAVECSSSINLCRLSDEHPGLNISINTNITSEHQSARSGLGTIDSILHPSTVPHPVETHEPPDLLRTMDQALLFFFFVSSNFLISNFCYRIITRDRENTLSDPLPSLFPA